MKYEKKCGKFDLPLHAHVEIFPSFVELLEL